MALVINVSVISGLGLAEGLTLSWPVSTAMIYQDSIESGLDLGETLSLVFLDRSPFLTDEIGFGDDLSLGEINAVLVTERLFLQAAAFPGSETWECWVLNTGAMQPSVYSGFNFNSYGDLDGQSFGAREEGIFLLEGDDDAGTDIHSGVVLPKMGYGSMHRIHFRKVFFDIEGDDPVFLAVADSIQGASLPITRKRVTLPRNLIGRKWSFMIGDFEELGMIELFPIVITR